VLAGGSDHIAHLWDAVSGNELLQFIGHSGPVISVQFSPDGKRVLTASDDHTSRLWESKTGAELCELISLNAGKWAVTDNAGRYDASDAGDVEGLHWVDGFEPIALSQLKQRYYDPGLLAKYLGFNKQPLKPVAIFRTVPLYPTVEVRPPTEGTDAFAIDLADQGGGIGRVQVFVNGKEVQADARGERFDPAAKAANLHVDLSRAASLMPGAQNTVRVVAWNREGWLSSRGLEFAYAAPGRANDEPVEWWGIVVGINDYAAPGLHLKYAGKDAHDMSTALKLGATRMFGGDHVHLTLLSSLTGDGAVEATKANIHAAFEAVRARAKPQDELVVYLAGHGVALRGEDDLYLYLTEEATSTDAHAFADRDAMAGCSVSSEELADWMRHAPPLKQVMILDTCSAGTAAARLVDRREIPGEQIRAMDRLKDRTGLHVLMGCSADAVSYEASRFGQGLLTYALLQGMRGGALREDQFVDVSLMFEHAANAVPELAKGIGGIQRPEIAAPRGGGGFDIGRMEQQDKQRVPLTMARPVLLRAVLLDADLGDSLNLGVAFTRQLREASHGAGQEPGAYVFVDADEMPGAVRVSGQYTVDGATAHVKLVLTRDHKRLATLNVDGPTADPAALSEALVRAIVAELPKMPVATP
jgi:hypothetical protein